MHHAKTRFILLILIDMISHSCGNDPAVQRPDFRKIRQSVKIHDDNVNGMDMRIQINRIVEATNFFYNTEGLLDSLNVMDDTLPDAHLIKSIKLTYYPSRIRASIYDDSTGTFYVDFRYNNNRQLTSIMDTLGIGFGLFVTYTDNKIDKIKSVLDSTFTLTNFVYDANNNLIQYIIGDYRNQPNTRVVYQYDYSRQIPQYMDIRFASAGIKYIYAGGINVISLMGMNYGLGNTHRILKRDESNLQTGRDGLRYLFEYGLNNNEEIVNRKITVSDTIEVFYEYRFY